MQSESTIPMVSINTTELLLYSEKLGREVACTLYLPEMDHVVGPLHLLLLNDGQDLPAMNFAGMLQELYENNLMHPVLTVGITAGDRLQEYGLSTRPDFKKRGARANEYRQFIVEELLPKLSETTQVSSFASYTMAGFSLGALSAFDIAWHHSDIFKKVGAFSGSFWWRSKDLAKGYKPSHRLTHQMVGKTGQKPDLKFWFQVGTKDETDDRDGNGIIDSIDDTTDLIGLLYRRGYQRNTDVTYLEILGGRHDVETWGRQMPKFLTWAFGY